MANFLFPSKEPTATDRGAKRLVFDFERTQDGKVGVKYSDYTLNHNYDNTNGYGQNDFDKYQNKNSTMLKCMTAAAEYGQKAVIAEECDTDDE